MKKILLILSIITSLLANPIVANAQFTIIQGGTGWSTSTPGDILYGTSSLRYSRLPIGSANSVLQSSGTSPAWSSILSLLGLTVTNSTTTNATTTNLSILGLSDTVLAVNSLGRVIATTTGSGNAITALTGDGTATGPGSVAFTLATVNSNIGSFGGSTAIPNFTVNGKGLITAAGTNAVIAPAGTLTGDTLAANVLNSSLTSLGTIANLSATNATITGLNVTRSTTTSATTTNFAITGLSSSVLAVDQNGSVIATTTGGGGGSGTVTSGLANQVTYYPANGDTVAGTSTLFVINEMLGIGTTSPSNRLEVNGSGYLSGNLVAANVTATNTVSATTIAAQSSVFSFGTLGALGQTLLSNASTTNLTVASNLNIGGLNSVILAVDQNGKVVATTTSSGGSGTVGTSSAETSGRIPFWTSTGADTALLSGGVSGFTFNSATNLFSFVNASGTNSTTTHATTTTFAISGLSNTILAVDANGSVIATTTSGGGGTSSTTDIQIFTGTTTAHTWTKPTNAETVTVIAIGGGGGGGRTNGGFAGGGGGGGRIEVSIHASLLGSTETVFVGAGSPGATSAGSTTNASSSSFGKWFIASGGGGGGQSSGGSGGSGMGIGSIGGSIVQPSVSGGATGGFGTTPGGNGYFNGAAGGGGVSSAPSNGAGGSQLSRFQPLIGGTAGGGNGMSASSTEPIGGAGGGGGGGQGGMGGLYGGGGGAGQNANGGRGGDGIVVVITTLSSSGGGGGSGTPGGSDTQVQFNDGGSFGGDAGFTYVKGTDTATLGTLNLTSLTASRILGSDTSKNVVALDTATYPSLTELSYVKGVTSAIQTQINGLVPYTGASGNVDLGSNGLTALNLEATSAMTTPDLFFQNLKDYSSSFTILSGRTLYQSDGSTPAIDFAGPITFYNGSYAFPSTDGSANQVLTTDGAGVLTWEDAGSGTVTSSLTGQTAYYAANGTTVVGTSTAFFTDGKYSVGTTTPAAQIHLVTTGNTMAIATSTLVERFVTNTSSSLPPLIVKQTTTGSANDGFGSYISFINQDNSSTQEIGRLRFTRSGDDAAGQFDLYTGNSGVFTAALTAVPNGFVTIPNLSSTRSTTTSATSTNLAVTGTTINLNGNPVYATSSKAMGLASTTLDAYGMTVNTGTTTLPLFNNEYPMTVTGFYCQATTTGQARIRFGDGTNWSQDAFCSTTGAFNAMSSNNTFDAFEPFVVQASSTASTTQRITFTVFYKNTP